MELEPARLWSFQHRGLACQSIIFYIFFFKFFGRYKSRTVLRSKDIIEDAEKRIKDDETTVKEAGRQQKHHRKVCVNIQQL